METANTRKLSINLSELQVTPDAGRLVWITGTGAVDGRLSEVLSCLMAEHAHVWNVAIPSDDMSTYAGIRAVLAQLIPEVQAECPELIEQYREALQFVCPRLIGTQDPPPSPLSAHAVTFAIVRRISRESLHTATQIDGTARFILAARRSCPGLAKPWCMIVRNFDLLDRPSLRILYRMMRLAVPADGLRLVALCTGNPLAMVGAPEGLDLRSRMATARGRIYQRVAADLKPTMIHLDDAAGLALPEPLPPFAVEDDYVLRTAENLVEQNYDQAYLLAECGLRHAGAQQVHADLWRLTGLVDANVGEYTAARICIERALELAPAPTLRAHLNYLVGLLLTKRDYDLDGADGYFQTGLQVLEREAADDAATAFERAWLHNGRALVATLRAKRLPPSEQSTVLEQVVLREIEAFGQVATGKEPHLVYLRHNLLANIAFLLEILKRYPDAINFWTKAFGQYLGKGSGQRFEPVYLYRVGMLQWRDGRQAESLESLRASLRGIRTLGERFLEERVLYALGYVALDAGTWTEAAAIFQEGLELAWDLRSWDACASHAIGLHRAATQSGDRVLADDAFRVLERLSHQSTLSAEQLLQQSLRQPSPKLPAYLPAIDLEPSPEVDLNRYLIQESAAALTSR